MIRTFHLMLAICLLLAAPGAALANLDFDRAMNQAKKAIAAKDAAAAMRALGKASQAAFDALPFTAINASLVAAPPDGYGRYIPRVDNVYRPGEPLVIYMEPVGYKVVRKSGDGAYEYNIVADFNLVDAWGTVVGGRRGFGRFKGESHRFPDRLPLTFTYSLAGLPPGRYRVETILHDKLGKASYTVSQEVVVTLP